MAGLIDQRPAIVAGLAATVLALTLGTSGCSDAANQYQTTLPVNSVRETVSLEQRRLSFGPDVDGVLAALESTDAGATWRPVTRPPIDGNPAVLRAVGDRLGAVHLVWVDEDTSEGRSRLLATSSPNWGRSWLPPIVVDSDAKTTGPVHAMLGKHGSLIVAYHDAKPSDRVTKELTFGRTVAIRGSFRETDRQPISARRARGLVSRAGEAVPARMASLATSTITE